MIQKTKMPTPSKVTLNAKEESSDKEEKLLWDGEVIEGAHDAEFESFDEADVFVPSFNFMSMANSVTSPALAVAAGEFDSLKNMGQIHQVAMEKEGREVMTEDDLLEMGGDPSFLDDVEDDAGFKGMGNFVWDGEVNEDAHLD